MFAGVEKRIDDLGIRATPDQKTEIAEISALARAANSKIDEAKKVVRRGIIRLGSGPMKWSKGIDMIINEPPYKD